MSTFNQVTVLRRAVEVLKRDFTDKQRKNAAKTGEAMPDGSFPIGNVEDLHSAVLLMHNAADPSEAKDHIMRRATALGAEAELPPAWGAGKKKPVKKDEGIVDIVSTLTTIQKDWAAFDAKRKGSGSGKGKAALLQHKDGNKSFDSPHDAVKEGLKRGGNFSVAYAP